MPFTAENLLIPLAWRTAIGDSDIRSVLNDIQANVLKPHGRTHVILSFLSFQRPVGAARAAARELGKASTTAYQQLQDATLFKETGQEGGTLITIALSAVGYAALDVPKAQPPGKAFAAGIRKRGENIPDLGLHDWESVFLGDLQALLLLADNDEARLANRHQELLRQAGPGVRQVFAETGVLYRDDRGDPVEHFGFVDGRSQPLLLEEDIVRERDEGGGDSRWAPGFPLSTALVPCPGGAEGKSFGSFLAFLKLEQNVHGFVAATRSLATSLKITPEYAAAMTVGRYRDGTSLTMRETEESFYPLWNNFNYREDLLGNRCPFHAHIRRMNPRGTSKEPATERKHAILRRGITYGHRAQDPQTKNFLDAPERGAGLFFMSYQRSLVAQFEFLFAIWAQGNGFPGNDKSHDQIIGSAGGPDPSWNLKWGQASGKTAPFGRYVTLKGGEYFFTPCRSFLKGL